MLRKIGRPSPALVIACISLFVALGGVGYAAATGSIDGREIKNNSVASKDIKNNSVAGGDIKQGSVTGSDIAEQKLGKVPSAAVADSAATAGQAKQADRAQSAATADRANTANSAGTANTVGGFTFRKVAFLSAVNQSLEIYDDGIIDITASCSNVGVNDDIDITVRSLREDSGIYGQSVDSEDTGANNPAAFDEEHDLFELGDELEVTDALGDDDPGTTSFTVHTANNANVVRGELIFDESPCRVAGLVSRN